MKTSNTQSIQRLGIFIGGMRCGSTALNDYLKQHPEVCSHKQKDPHFFSSNDNWKKGWSYYLDGWSHYNIKLHKIAFESSTHYTKFPLYPESAERIASFSGDVRLIYGVRDPIARIESHFIHNAGKGYINPENIEERLKLLKQAINVSNYDLQIMKYEKYFPPNKIYILSLHDLKHNPGRTLSDVADFLGIDTSHKYEPIAIRPRKFKYSTSGVLLTDEEKQQAMEQLYSPVSSFERRYGIKLWNTG